MPTARRDKEWHPDGISKSHQIKNKFVNDLKGQPNKSTRGICGKQNLYFGNTGTKENKMAAHSETIHET